MELQLDAGEDVQNWHMIISVLVYAAIILGPIYSIVALLTFFSLPKLVGLGLICWTCAYFFSSFMASSFDWWKAGRGKVTGYTACLINGLLASLLTLIFFQDFLFAVCNFALNLIFGFLGTQRGLNNERKQPTTKHYKIPTRNDVNYD